MESNTNPTENKKSSTFLVTSTLIGVLSIALLAAFYYLGTNTHLMP